VSPTQANLILFFLGPLITLIFSLLGFAVVPRGPTGYIFNFIHCFIFYIISCKLYSCNLLYNFYFSPSFLLIKQKLNNSSDNKAISFLKNFHYNNTNLNKLKMSDSEFNQWLTGFSDSYHHFRNKGMGQNKSTECRALMVWGTNLTSPKRHKTIN